MDAFPKVLEEVRNNAISFSEKLEEPAILLVTPTRGVMEEYEPWEILKTNEHNGTNPPDTKATRISKAFLDAVEEFHKAGIVYELTDEKVFEEAAKFEAGFIVLGNRRYKSLYIPSTCKCSSVGKSLIDQIKKSEIRLLEQNYKVLFIEKKATEELKEKIEYIHLCKYRLHQDY